jgi:hypothetical protein
MVDWSGIEDGSAVADIVWCVCKGQELRIATTTSTLMMTMINRKMPFTGSDLFGQLYIPVALFLFGLISRSMFVFTTYWLVPRPHKPTLSSVVAGIAFFGC